MHSSLPWASVVGAGGAVVLGGAVVFGVVLVAAGCPAGVAVPLPFGAVVDGFAVLAGNVVAAGGVVDRRGAGAESTGCVALLRCDVDGALVVAALVLLAVVGAVVLLAGVVVFGVADLLLAVGCVAALDVVAAELFDEPADVDGLVASTPVSGVLLGVEAPARAWDALPGLPPPPALLTTNHTRPISTTTAAAAASDRRSQYTLGDRGPTGCITNPTVTSESC